MSKIQTFDFSVNLLRALLWRNNEAVNIQALIQFKQDYSDTDSRDFWNSWIEDVFDLRTANEFGLSVWAIILGVNITIEPTTLPAVNTNWGYGSFRVNYFGANYAPTQGGIVLNAEDARLILRLRYYQLTTNGNVLDINALLQDVFGHLGAAYVVDNLDMTIHYQFLFVLSSSLVLALQTFDALPRPAGVLLTFSFSDAGPFWGFGPFNLNFNRGNFAP